MEIIAHRGASADAPENTLAAIQLGWQQGADAVEADFQLTRDGHLIALHDDDLLRTAGVKLRADELSLAELQSYDVGQWKHSRWTGERIPTLSEMLATIPPGSTGKRFFVEIKTGEASVAELARVVQAAGKTPDQVVIISLDRATCAAVKKVLPKNKVYWVVDFTHDPQTGNWSPGGDAIVSAALADQLDGLDLMATGPIDAGLVNNILLAKLELCVWTVDDPILARRLLDFGVQGITTNRPEWLRHELRKSTGTL